MFETKEHIFLAAAPRSGKSTVIDAVLKALPRADVGGFRSYFGDDRDSANRSLYLCAAGEPPLCDKAHAVARFYSYGTYTAHPERFDRAALEYITARRNSDILVMDECSFLERDALVWQREILAALDGDAPVLGVLRLFDGCWTNKIASHPRVRTLALNADNRDALASGLAEHYRRLLSF